MFKTIGRTLLLDRLMRNQENILFSYYFRAIQTGKCYREFNINNIT